MVYLNKSISSLLLSGFHVKSSQGAILDATIITSAARPRKELDTIVTDRQEDNVACTPSAMNLSKDPDARWLKKGCRSYFGYKGFVVTDSQSRYIQHVHVTPAHTSEVKTLPEIVAAHPIQGRLYADKGYASSDNDTILAALNIKNGIMKKAAKERPLRWSQRYFNKLISHVRYKVEQCFGTLKRRFNCGRASYMGLEKVTGQLIIKAIAYNLLKAIRASGKMALNISSAM